LFILSCGPYLFCYLCRYFVLSVVMSSVIPSFLSFVPFFTSFVISLFVSFRPSFLEVVRSFVCLDFFIVSWISPAVVVVNVGVFFFRVFFVVVGGGGGSGGGGVVVVGSHGDLICKVLDRVS
jgi:hypothetical protein